jgi:hypothetical protein
VQEEDFMSTAKRFKLTERTLAIEVLDGVRKSVSIPEGSVIAAVSGTDSGQTVEVLWGCRKLEIFACDLSMRGTEIIDPQSQKLNDTELLKRQGRKRGVA